MASIESVTLQATDPAAAERFYAAVFELDAQLQPQASEHRVENLEIWSKAQPCGQRVVNKLAFAVEMLDRSAVELWSESFTDRELSRAADAVKLLGKMHRQFSSFAALPVPRLARSRRCDRKRTPRRRNERDDLR